MRYALLAGTFLLAACSARTGSSGGSPTGGGSSGEVRTSGGGTSGGAGSTGGSATGGGTGSTGGPVSHEVYVLPNDGSGTLVVYDMDHAFAELKRVAIPQLAGTTGIRGAIATPVSGLLYVSWLPGNLLAYDLIHDQVAWTHAYPSIDSLAISPDGKALYMSPGDWISNGIFDVLDAATGDLTRSIDTKGSGPHDIEVTLDGTRVFLGPMNSNYLVEADTATGAVVQDIGPVSDGVRPFTLNGAGTLVFINTIGVTGFDAADAVTGRILYEAMPPGFTQVAACGGSHGVSLSPDEREVYLVDCSYSTAHVFDVTGLPAAAPVDVADIALATPMKDEGWIDHTRDGRYVLVGSCGDVIDTATRRVVGHLTALESTKIFTEIDFQNGVPSFSPLSREQGGYVVP